MSLQAATLRGMKSTGTAAVAFRLAAPGLGYSVDVTVRGFADRWVATAAVGDRREVGLASSPRVALDAALGWLPAADRCALVADTSLLEPSVELASLARG